MKPPSRRASSARSSVLQRRAFLAGAAAVMVGCGHRGEDPSAHQGYDPPPPPCESPRPETMQIGVMRVAGDAGAGTTVLRIRTHWPGLELREAPGDWTVVDGLLHLSVSAEFAHVRVSFVRSRQPDCEDRWPVEYDIDVALVPSDRELSVGPAARR